MKFSTCVQKKTIKQRKYESSPLRIFDQDSEPILDSYYKAFFAK